MAPTPKWLALVIAMLVVGSLTGCGKKSVPPFPEGSPGTFPRPYPNPATPPEPPREAFSPN